MAFEYSNKNKKSRLSFNYFYNNRRNDFFFAEIYHDFNYFNIFTNYSDISAEFWNNIYLFRKNFRRRYFR
jgi:hypothetical protein